MGKRRKPPNKTKPATPVPPEPVQVVLSPQPQINKKPEENNGNNQRAIISNGISVTTKEIKSLGLFSLRFLAHSLAILILVAIGMIGDYVVKHLLHDPKVFDDKIPLRYAIGIGDFAIILTLAIKFIKEYLKDENKKKEN